MSYTTHALSIPALDEFPLPACCFTPDEDIQGVILLCPGLGIPKEFYLDYCSFLSERKYVVIVFDYRGIGKDDQSSRFEINLRNWAKHDIPGILNWIKEKYPNKKIFYFGHSVAGQIAGLIPNHQLIERFIFISSTGGYWTLFNFPLNLFTIFMFYIHIPLTSRLFGYMPPSLTYRGVRIAKGVALEWAKISRKKDYLSAFFGKTINDEFYKDIKQNIDWITFKDDTIATERAVSYMANYFSNAAITHHKIDTDNLSERIGHAGFFRSKSGKMFWQLPLELIRNNG